MGLPAAGHLSVAGARRETRWSWGRTTAATGWVCRPRDAEEVAAVFAAARAAGLTVGFRGGGQSYGDAALNDGHVLLETAALDRIRAFDADGGRITVDAGVTYERLWETTLPAGWWPPVVPGTMHATLGGALAMNVHGKNHPRAGTLGEHVETIDLVLPTGEARRLAPGDPLFAAVVGGFGMLGCIVALTLRLQRVASGWLDVRPFVVGGFEEMIAVFEAEADAEHLVGWIDALGATGAGRGLVHAARHLPPGAPADDGLALATQRLPRHVLGVFPAAQAWRLGRLVAFEPGVRALNALRWHLGRAEHGYRQTHTGFAFLLNRFPHWERAYGRHGLVQYQSFVPAAQAAGAFREQLRLARRAGVRPWMGIFKRHRPDPFLVSYGVDGYSLGLDFKVTAANRAALWRLAADLDRVVLDAGGRFYLAKDSTLERSRFAASLGEAFDRFVAVKAACDPEGLLATDLSRRVLGGSARPAGAPAR